MRHVRLVLAAAALSSCIPSISLPEGAEVACEIDAHCPGTYRCHAGAGRCVPTDSDDVVAPSILAATPSSLRLGADDVATVTLTVSEPLLHDPQCRVGERALNVLERRLGAEPVYVLSYRGEGDEPEGSPMPGACDIIDPAGNEASLGMGVEFTFDFTAPSLTSGAELSIQPLPHNPHPDPTALGELGVAYWRATASEPLGEALIVLSPEDEGEGEDITFDCPVNLAQVECVFGIEEFGVSPAPVYRGRMVLTDEVGNASSPLGLDDVLRVDTVPPEIPNVFDEEAIVYTRAPWLAAPDGGVRSSFTIRGLPGSVEPGAWVRVHTPGGTVIATTQATPESAADGGGAFGALADPAVPLALDDIDRELIDISVVDAAGNASERVRVRQVDWVATMAGKESGSFFGNPHLFEARPRFERTILELPTVLDMPGRALAEEDYDPENPEETTIVTTRGGAAWRNRTYDSDSPQGQLAAVGADPVRGEVLAVTVEGQVYRRRGGPFSRVLLQDNEGDGDPVARSQSAMAFDPASHRLILFGGRQGSTPLDDMWAFSARGFTRLCASSSCTRPSARYGHAMTTDPLERRVVLHGGSAGSRETWAWDGSSWSLLCDGGACAGGMADDYDWVRLTYDMARGELLLLAGAPDHSVELWGFRDGAWTLRCPTSDCTPLPVSCATAGWAYDSVNAVAVAVLHHNGGSCTDAQFGVSDTWLWDGAAWHRPTPVSSFLGHGPVLAADALLVFDGASQSVWRLGNSSQSGEFLYPGELRTTVTESTVTHVEWVKRAPQNSQPGTYDGAAYMSSHGVVARVAAREGRDLVQVWSGHSWNGSLLLPSEMADDATAAGYFEDASAQEVVVLAPQSGSSRLTLWAYRLFNFGSAEWQERWTDGVGCAAPPCAWPSGTGHRMAFNGSETILFGGNHGSMNLTNATWAWTGSAWETRCTSDCTPPPGRIGHALSADPVTGDVYLFGGANLGGSVGLELWRYRDGTWELLPPGDTLPPGAWRYQPALSVDSTRRRVILFGGAIESPFAGSPNTPNCGFGAGPLCADTWEYDLEQYRWRKAHVVDLEDDGAPTPLKGASLIFDTERQEHVLVGGILGNGSQNTQTWTYDSGATSGPAQVMSVALAAASPVGRLGHSIERVEVRWVGGGSGWALEDGGDYVPTPGVDLLVWRSDRWQRVGGSPTASTAQLEAVTSTLQRASLELTGTFTGPRQSLSLALTPRAPNGNDTAEVVSDSVEVRVRYVAEGP